MKRGIDLSRHNGNIDWDKVKAAGIEFAILRCGLGRYAPSQIDPQFARNYAEAKRVGIPIGVYHYSYAQSVEAAEMEADFCLQIIRGKQFEYPIYFDIEEKTQQSLSMELCGKMIRAFCGKLERAGYWAGIYSYDSFFRTNIADDIEKRYAVWVARIENIKPTLASVYQMWQYSWKGKIDGIYGDVDLNYCYADYPELIKAKGKNGYGKNATYTVTARMAGQSLAAAREIAEECQKNGMTVVIAED